jgi:hypothetical protein
VAGGSRVLVVFNQAEAPANLHIPLDGSGFQSGVRPENLAGTTPPVEVRQGALNMKLPGHSAAIYR